MISHKILDLFSGIGGFTYGFEKANLGRTIAFVEKDEFCQKVLKKHWKDVPIIDDIRKVNGKDFESATIVSGGFPCQPFSTAGKRKGTDDDRYLWDETIRVVAETKPKWFIGENVEGIINISEGAILQQIQEDLEKEGFQVQCLVIPASGIGAWHQRKRVWIIAYSDSNCKSDLTKYGQERSRELGKSYVSNPQNRSREQTQWQGRESIRRRSNDRSRLERERKNISSNVPNANSRDVQTGCEGSRAICKKDQGKRSSDSIASSSKANDISNFESCRFRIRVGERSRNHQWSFQTKKQKGRVFRSKFERCAFQDEESSWWQTQYKFCGVPDGISYGLHKDRVNRLKALGNSIVPQIAQLIGESILTAEKDS